MRMCPLIHNLHRLDVNVIETRTALIENVMLKRNTRVQRDTQDQ